MRRRTLLKAIPAAAARPAAMLAPAEVALAPGVLYAETFAGLAESGRLIRFAPGVYEIGFTLPVTAGMRFVGKA